MLTRHSGQSNCWSGGLRGWAGGRLIAGDYKPQSGGLVSGFDQTNSKAHTQLQAVTHVHTQTDVHGACVSIYPPASGYTAQNFTICCCVNPISPQIPHTKITHTYRISW